MALGTYATRTLDEFIDEIYRSYPKADRYLTGTMERLEEICSEYSGMSCDDLENLSAFVRSFRAVAKKPLIYYLPYAMYTAFTHMIYFSCSIKAAMYFKYLTSNSSNLVPLHFYF